MALLSFLYFVAMMAYAIWMVDKRIDIIQSNDGLTVLDVFLIIFFLPMSLITFVLVWCIYIMDFLGKFLSRFSEKISKVNILNKKIIRFSKK